MPGRFSSKTVETLSKRAGMSCSNPECGALTAGPSDDHTQAVNIGEAAHIHGLTPDSARHNPLLSHSELGDITNGIWLCRNCHKTIDADELGYPIDLLFAWRRAHEASVKRRLGRQHDPMRDVLDVRRLKAFENASYLAQQIIIDKPPYWEYKLTIELLRTELGEVHKRWYELKNSLYVRPSTALTANEIPAWFQRKCDHLVLIVSAISKLVDGELTRAWGPPGQPGSETEILQTCRLIVAAGENLLEWEEELHFTRFPSAFQEVKDLWTGLVGAQLDELMRAPAELSRIFEVGNPTGEHFIHLNFQLPDEFVEASRRAWRRSTRRATGKDPDAGWQEVRWKLRRWWRAKNTKFTCRVSESSRVELL